MTFNLSKRVYVLESRFATGMCRKPAGVCWKEHMCYHRLLKNNPESVLKKILVSSEPLDSVVIIYFRFLL